MSILLCLTKFQDEEIYFFKILANLRIYLIPTAILHSDWKIQGIISLNLSENFPKISYNICNLILCISISPIMHTK